MVSGRGECVKCPHCEKTFDWQDCITEPGAVPQEGDAGICAQCCEWWELSDGRPRKYKPTREEMEMAFDEMEDSVKRFKEKGGSAQ